MIEVRDLSVGHEGVPLLSGLDFRVERGEVFGILGASGCGKTTLFRHLIGLQEPLAGSIEVEGAATPRSAEAPPPWGVAFQQGALFTSLTLAENVAVPLRRWTRLSERSIEIVALGHLRLVGLGGFENHLPSAVSGGMRKRASVARALALDPVLLFFDEPSAGLDPVTAAELDELLCRLRDDHGVTLVIVTHELESIFRVVDRCILLDRDAGGIIARGEPRRLRDESRDRRVRSFFRRLSRTDSAAIQT